LREYAQQWRSVRRQQTVHQNNASVLTGQDRTSLDPNNPNSLWFNAAAFSVPAQFAFGTSSQYNSKFSHRLSCRTTSRSSSSF
jgi:hypothetical protein